jgi:aminoglycoside phosphotransferase (APT) family kinase protein
VEPLADRLLAELRQLLAAPALEYLEPPAQISGGFDTLIYGFALRGAPAEWSAPLILRVFRAETRTTQPRFEGAVQNCLAEQGLCVPRTLLVVEDPVALGGAFMVMERAAGRNLLSAVFSLSGLRVPRWLAETQLRLHALDATALERALAGAGFDPAERTAEGEIAALVHNIDSLALFGLKAGARWLEQRRPAAAGPRVVCHGDYHPLNLVQADGRVTGVIDWARVHVAPPEYDVGSTIALMSHGPVSLPGPLAPLARGLRGLLVRRYVAVYQRGRPLDGAAMRFFEALRLMRFLYEEGLEQAAERDGYLSSKRRPWADPDLRLGIRRRFESLTGVAASLPRDEARAM